MSYRLFSTNHSCGKIPHDIPDADACQLIFSGKRSLARIELRVLKPDLVLGTVAPVAVVRRLRRVIIMNRRTDLNRLLDGLHVAQIAGARLSCT